MSVALLVVLALIVGGAIPVDSPAPAGTTDAVGQPAPPRSTKAATTTGPGTTATATPSTTARAEPTVVVLTAVRGDSWFSARVGSEGGRVLDERVLAQGDTVRLQGRRIWLSVGAAGNVELTVDGEPRELAPGTVSLVLTPSI